jgi:hypothetical protein
MLELDPNAELDPNVELDRFVDSDVRKGLPNSERADWG